MYKNVKLVKIALTQEKAYKLKYIVLKDNCSTGLNFL